MGRVGSLARALVAVLLRGPSAARSDPATRPDSGAQEERGTMTVSRIATTSAPAAVGPYSQGVSTGQEAGSLVFVSGLGYDDVVKTTVLLADIADFAAVNEVYARYFTGETLPARAAFGVAALPLGAGVEIEAIAARA